MQPAQICCWQATIPSAGLEENGAAVGTSKKNKTLHKGKDTVITQQQWTHLFDYFELLCAECPIVSVWILAIKLHRLDATYIGEPQSMLDWKKQHCFSLCHMNCTEHQVQSSCDR